MEQRKPLILITNDDGIDAPGIHELVNYVKEMGDIVVIAPDAPHSGQSSAISVNKVLQITAHPDYNGAKMYSINGTPVDCVKLGIHAIVPRRPDLLLSGINHGSNSGQLNNLFRHDGRCTRRVYARHSFHRIFLPLPRPGNRHIMLCRNSEENYIVRD